MKTTPLVPLLALSLAVFSCQNGSDTGNMSSGLASRAGSTAGNLVSVVRHNDISGVEQVEAWKVEAEMLADAGGDAVKTDYLRFKGLVDAWVTRKKAEVTAASSSSLSRKADLSRASISAPLEQSWQKLASYAGSKSIGTAAVIGIAKKINDAIVQGKENQATLINQQLDALRLAAWGA